MLNVGSILYPTDFSDTAKQALQYLVLVAETLGSDWLTNKRFRFGASSLLNDLLRQLIRRQEGTYPSPRRISVD